MANRKTGEAVDRISSANTDASARPRFVFRVLGARSEAIIEDVHTVIRHVRCFCIGSTSNPLIGSMK